MLSSFCNLAPYKKERDTNKNTDEANNQRNEAIVAKEFQVISNLYGNSSNQKRERNTH